MTDEKPKFPKTVKMKPPSWTFAMGVYINVLEHGDSEEGKQAARDDLMDLARNIDARQESKI